MEKKKIIIIAIASVLALALLITGSVFLVKNFFKGGSSSGKGDFVISVGQVEGKIGDTVKVPVSCEGNPGVMAVMGSVSYDTSMLTYKGYEEGKNFSDYMFNEKSGTVSFNIVENEDIDKDGVIFNLEFEITAEKSGKTDLTVSILEGGICNFNEEILTPELKNGSVNISK